ncbi:MAG: glycosyltransferase family 39 protein [Anaerolineae bacterium]|nr:glycosyltransferase family 39 protein [Anaerolineae bacterium]
MWRKHITPSVGLVVVIIFYIILAIFFSQVTPFNKGPDEGINLDYIEFIAVHGRLPITYDERTQVGPKANWPPLYHLIVASAGNLFDIDFETPPSIKVFWDSFRYQAMDLGTENAWHILTEDQKWPYYGRILVLHIGRWFSILFSSLTLVLIYLVFKEILPCRLWLAVAGTALLAFIPTFIFVGAALNEDALIAALAAFYFWILIRVMKQPQKLWPYWAMGLTIGLSVTTKYTTVVLPLEVMVVLAAIAWQQGYSWYWWVKRVTIVGGSAILASSWWFGWNFWFLNEIEKFGLIPGLLRPLFTGGYDVTLSRLGNFLSGGQIGLTDVPEGTQIGTFFEWVQYTALSFWGVSFRDTIPFSPYVYLLVGLMVAVAIFGLWRLWQMDTFSHRWLILLISHTGIFIIAPVGRFWLSRRIGQTAQGRHILIPAAAAIATLLVWGLVTAIPPRWQRLIFTVIVVTFVGWTVAHIYHLVRFAVSPLPMRTLPQAAEWLSYSAHSTFGESIELTTYEIDPQSQGGLLDVNLTWRSLAHVNESYLLKVELVNSKGEVVSHWLGYNGQGRLPTLAWDPGDVIFDRLALPLPDLPAGTYWLQVQLLGSNGGPIPLKKDGEGTVLSLAEVALSTPAHFSLDRNLRLAETDITFDLWQTGGPVESETPSYRYPATVGVIVAPFGAESILNVELVDPTGQVWPANQNQAGIFTFVIGPRWLSGDYRLQMTLQKGDEIIGQATTAPLLNIENWWPRRFEIPEIAVPLEANFANQLKFLGYDLPQKQVQTGAAFPITLYWQALPDRSPQANFVQFNHLLDSKGNLSGGYDRHPLEYYSTLLWAPGEVVVDGYTVPVSADAPPGEYYLDVGYYLTVGESAVNLPLVVDGKMTDVSSVAIGPIDVVTSHE